jgi:hypothetical protein
MSLITINLDIVEKLKLKENFSFSRYGDGEWNCLLGKKGQNCDAHKYFDDLGAELKRILFQSPNYYIGLQNLAYTQQPDLISKITETYNLKWCNSDMLHHMSIKNTIQPFFDALKGRNVLLVAPNRLKKLDIWNQFISVPEKDCWLSYELIKKEIQLQIKKDIVILYCASMMSNVLIDHFSSEDITQIDCGSVFEPFIGHANRTYHANKIKQLRNEQ